MPLGGGAAPTERGSQFTDGSTGADDTFSLFLSRTAATHMGARRPLKARETGWNR